MSDDASSKSLHIETVAIIGVGLIGGSIVAALKERDCVGRVIGCGRNMERLQAAQNAGLLDEITTKISVAASQANLVIVCTPVNRIVEDVQSAAAHARPGTIITDGGSVKAAICDQLATGLPEGVTFVGSHPLAGSEKQGFEHARSDLFDGRLCVVTPVENTPDEAIAHIRAFWAGIGATVVELSPRAHDRILAKTSHVPHAAAAALAGLLEEADRPFAASGFRDTTRIAAGDPALWTAILLANADSVADGLGQLERRIAEIRQAIVQRDASALKNLLAAAKTNRDALS
jgi:prephenate dehydrogenase